MSPKPRRSRMVLMFGGLFAIIFLVLAINVWLATRPAAVRARVQSILEDNLGAPFEIGSAEFDLSDGVLIEDLRVLRPAGAGNAQVSAVIDLPRVRIVPYFGELLLGNFEPRLVVVEGGEAVVSIGSDGKLSLSGLLRPSSPAQTGSPTARVGGTSSVRLPDFRINDFTVRFSDSRKDLAVTAEGLDLDLHSDAEGGLVIKTGFRLEGAAKVEAEARLAGGISALSEGPLDVTFLVFEFDPLGRLSVLLGEKARKLARERSFKGRIDLDGAVHFDAESGWKLRRLKSSLAGCRLVVPGIERPLRLGAGSVELSGDRLEISDARGEIAGGKMSLSGSVGLDPENGSVTTLKGLLRVDSLPVDEELLGALAPGIDRSYPGIVVRGRAGLVCEAATELKYPPALEALSATVELSDFRVAHADFDSPVENLSGTLELDKGIVKVARALTGTYGAARLGVSKISYDAAGDGAFEAVVDLGGEKPAECLALDGRMRSILSEKVKGAVKVWDNLEPEGWVAVKARIIAGAPAGDNEKRPEPYVILSVYPRQLKIRYRGFPYVVEKISGEALYDSRSPSVGVNLDLQGWHGERKIACKGSFGVRSGPQENADKPPRLALSITCEHLEYDKDIRAALKPEVARLIDLFAFKGGFRTSVEISRSEDGKLQAKTVLDLLAGEIRPVDFPYLLKLGAGRVVLLGSRKVDFSGFRTAEAPDARVVFDASLRQAGDKHRLDYNLRLKDFEIDKNLRQAFPVRFKKFVTGFGLQGTFSGRLGGWYEKDPEDPSNNKTYFEGTEFQTRNAAVNFGVKISEMDAHGRFTGGNEKGRPNHFWGEVRVEKARFNRLQLTDGDIVFTFGEPHDRIRRLAENAEAAEESAPYLSSSIIGRLSQGDVSQTFQMSIASDNFYKGRLDGMLYIDTGEKMGDLGGEFAASGLQLSEASRDIFRLGAGEVRGEAGGKVFFAGKTGDQRSIRGEGFGSIRNAELARLPLFLGIFRLFDIPNLVNLGFSDLVKRSKIDSLDIPYRIENGLFITEDLRMKSANSILSFSGVGSMDFEGRLALELEPQLTKSRIKVPILTDLIDLTGIDLAKILSFIKKGILKIKVNGDVADPKVELATGLGLIGIPIDSGKPGKKAGGRDKEKEKEQPQE